MYYSGGNRITRSWHVFRRWSANNKRILIGLAGAVLVALVLLVNASIAPNPFPRNTIIRIEKDSSVTRAASLLKEKGVIRSAFIYKVYVTLLHDGHGIQAGSYLFDRPQSSLRVAYRTSYGIKNIDRIRLTIFEGMNSKQIAQLIKKQLPDFASDEFMSEARLYEGYLFPETYFIDPDTRPVEIVDMMREQFDKGTDYLAPAFATSSHPLSEIIIMASIIEEEASNPTDRRIISGILWKRIQEGMPLQVDVPFYYVLGKTSSQLTRDDLATSSPYNTYKNKGLPPGPISNPGLDAIEAALYPQESKYYFYLADRRGTTHYASTHDGHVANIGKYLR